MKQILKNGLQIFKKAGDLLWPPLCFSCNQIFNEGSFLCSSCWSALERFPNTEQCRGCGCDWEDLLCNRCLLENRVEKQAIFCFTKEISSLIYAYKQGGSIYLSELLGAFLAVYCLENMSSIDVVTAVPRSSLKKFFNPLSGVERIAKVCASYLKKPYLPVLKKKWFSGRQQGKQKKEREKLGSCFILKEGMGEKISGKRILLIDDVITTGTTLDRAASALEEGSPFYVEALAIAYTLK